MDVANSVNRIDIENGSVVDYVFCGSVLNHFTDLNPDFDGDIHTEVIADPGDSVSTRCRERL